jgi:hypothetical protein
VHESIEILVCCQPFREVDPSLCCKLMQFPEQYIWLALGCFSRGRVHQPLCAK